MSEKLDAHEIAYYAVRGTNRDPVKDVAEVEKMIEEYAEAKAGQQETIVIGLPPLKEMEGEILEALENLDIIVHADEPMIGNRFATASAIYKVFKNKIDQ